MKNVFNTLFALIIGAMVLAFASCSSDGDSGNGFKAGLSYKVDDCEFSEVVYYDDPSEFSNALVDTTFQYLTGYNIKYYSDSECQHEIVVNEIGSISSKSIVVYIVITSIQS